LAAGAITSNLKLDQREVTVQFGEGRIETGLAKFGAIVGDYAEVGCNVVMNPGTVVGRKSMIYAGVSARGVIAENSIVKLRQ
jgi:acetyltransferase-like isoleucine patch superfamily enzyme